MTEHAGDLGYALLLRRYVDDPAAATPAQIERAAWDTVPSVGWMFWSFRVMVGLGFFFIGLFAVGFYLASRRWLAESRRYSEGRAVEPCRCRGSRLNSAGSSPNTGASHGRSKGVLPTFLAVSPIATSEVALSLAGFVIFYTVLAVIDVFLLKKYVKLGPAGGAPTGR